MKRFLITLIYIFLLNIIINAQTSCPTIVTTALDTLSNQCDNISRNEICYGYPTINVSPQDGIQSLQFAETGDIESIERIRSIQLSAMDVDMTQWGIASMKVQANLPDTFPGQNITFVLFGDVAINDASQRTSEIDVAINSTQAINVRGGPATTYNVITTLQPDITVTAIGRNINADWIQINLPDTEENGWVASFLLDDDADYDQLSVSSTDTVRYKPMQAFYLQTGMTDKLCEELPSNGLLIQTPQGVGTIDLIVNEVTINVGSTVFIEAIPDQQLTLSVLEGEIEATSFGKTVTVPEGAFSTVQLDGLSASGTPSDPEAYETDDLASLPINSLPEEIDIAESASIVQIQSAITDNQCRVISSGTVNLRSGPGTVYPVTSSLDADTTPRISSQFVGQAGDRWWQLTNQAWVSASVVDIEGNCDSIPTVTQDDIPPTPTPAPINTASDSGSTSNQASSNPTYLFINTCQDDGGHTRPANRPIIIAVGVGTYSTAEDTQAVLPTVTGSATLNGVGGTYIGNSGVESGPAGYGFHLYFQFDALPPGSYPASGTSSRPGGVPDFNGFAGAQTITATCTLTLQ